MRVRTPATSANLGPGFDALGLALARYDDVCARVTTGGYRVSVTGEGAGELPTGADHLVVRAMLATFDELGERPPGLDVECVNRIPQARGLGSSSAAIVAGVLLARALVVDGARRLDDAGALRIAAALEGHPDNVAPCLLGGFTIAWTESTGPSGAGAGGDTGAAGGTGAGGDSGATGDTGAAGSAGSPDGTAEPAAGDAAGGPATVAGGHTRAVSGHARAVSLAPAPGVRPVVFVPDGRGLTAHARAALPATVPHADAAHAAGRAALLVHAVTAAPQLLFPATEDRLHQDYRAPGAPDTAALVAALRAVGVAAVVSGAGPTVLALSPVPAGFAPGPGWQMWPLAVDVTGALVRGGTLGHAERDPVAAGRTS